MTTRPALGKLVVVLQAVLLVLFFLAFPGLGIETRPYTSYASWAGPLFLVLTLLIFGAGLATLALLRRRGRVAAALGIVGGITAVAVVALDLSHVGGLPAPLGPLVLGLVSAAVAVALIVAAAKFRSTTLGRNPEPT
jgi:peptidoglycan/LPS O-acetylase OafA/YrhL